MNLELLEFINTCRTCGRETVEETERTPIFGSSQSKHAISEDVFELLITLQLEVKQYDGLPQNLCNQCVSTFSAICEFVRECEKVQKDFIDYFKARKKHNKQSLPIGVIRSSSFSRANVTIGVNLDDNDNNINTEKEVKANVAKIEDFPKDGVTTSILTEQYATEDIKAENETTGQTLDSQLEHVDDDEVKTNVLEDEDWLDDVNECNEGIINVNDKAGAQIVISESDLKIIACNEIVVTDDVYIRNEELDCNYAIESTPKMLELPTTNHNINLPNVSNIKEVIEVSSANDEQFAATRNRANECSNENGNIFSNDDEKFLLESDKIISCIEEQISRGGHEDIIAIKQIKQELLTKRELLASKYSDVDMATSDDSNHIQSSYNGEEKSQCLSVKTNSQTNQSIRKNTNGKMARRRINTEVKTETCPFCKGEFICSSRHIVKCPKRNIEVCKYCLLAFKSSEELQNHVEKLHSDGLPTCHVCFCTFATHKKRTRHMENVHNDKIYKCTICNSVLKNKYTFQKHNQLLHSKVINKECPICHKFCETEYLYNHHMQAHTDRKKYQCRYCGKGYMQVQHRNSHERSHTGERPFLCDACGLTFKEDFALKTHLVKHGRLPVVRKSYTDEGIFNCKKCGKTLHKRTAYYNHLQKHKYENMNFPCEKCKNVYKTKLTFKLHRCGKKRNYSPKSVDRVYPYNCAICNKGFALHSSLASHVEKHKENREHACTVCNAEFKTYGHLKIHMERIHHKERKFKCSICERRFISKNEVVAHQKVHSDDKPFKCDKCPKTFKWKNILVKHAIVHTGEKPFACEVCGERFRAYLGLETHRATHPIEEVKRKEQELFYALSSDVQRETAEEIPIQTEVEIQVEDEAIGELLSHIISSDDKI